MAYLAVSDVVSRVGGMDRWVELTDDDDDSQPDDAIVSQLTTQIDDLANGYFAAGGYAVPVADVTPVYSALLDIVNFKAHSRGNRQPSDADLVLYNSAIALLEGVAAGKVALPTSSGAASADSYGIDSGDDRVFSRDELEGY
jgi:phage gp36-like protein